MRVHAVEGVLALLALPALISGFSTKSDKVLLSSVQTLTLRKGAMTTGRRLRPIPQLALVGGNAKGLYEVDAMQCRNMGSGDGGAEDVQWKCVADIPGYFKLGRTDVVCEGYRNADDPYVLRGSCGVEYTLHLTEAGMAKYGRRKDYDDSWSFVPTLLIFLAIAATVYALSHVFFSRTPSRPRPPRAPFFGNFFGGDDDGNPPPPPPYSRHDGGGKAFSAAQQQQRAQWQQNQWRPGFWSGLGAGAAAMAAYNSLRGPSTAERAGMVTDSILYDDFGRTRRTSWESTSSRQSSPRESTGFGGTSRR